MDDQTFALNLKALERYNPHIAHRLETLSLLENVQLGLCANDEFNVLFDGKPLHCVESPFEEARRVFEETVPPEHRGPQAVIFQYGMGLGYLLQRCFVETEATIVVYEPYLPVLRQTLAVVDFTPLLESGRVILATEIMDILSSVGEQYLVGDYFVTQELPAYRQVDPEAYLAVLNDLRGTLVQTRINQNTHLARMEAFTRMSIQNIPLFLPYPTPQFLHDEFTGVPGVIVSAGPSLDKPGVLDALREHQDNLMIVAVGQAARALDKAGIIPDFVCQIECADVSHQLDGISFLDKTTHVLLPQSHANSYSVKTARKLIAHPNQDPLTEWLASALEEPLFGYSHQGTVSISCLVLLRLMGCNPIFIVGQDLAFPNGQLYSKDSVYEGATLTTDAEGKRVIQWPEAVLEKLKGAEGIYESEAQFAKRNRMIANSLVEVKGWDDEVLYSPCDYMGYAKVFESLRLMTDEAIKLVNCSEGGRYLSGYDHMPLAEALAQYTVSSFHPKPKLAALYSEHYLEEPSTESSPKMARLQQRYQQDELDLRRVEALASKNVRDAERVLSTLKRQPALSPSVQKTLAALSRRDEDMQAICARNTLINNYVRRELVQFAQFYGRQCRGDFDASQAGDIAALVENTEAALLIYKATLKGVRGLLQTLTPVLSH